jgi:hypothetical protein
LVTQYSVGDAVALIDDTDTWGNTLSHAVRRLHVGEVGTIRKIVISDPNDGDATVLMFYVRFARVTTLLAAPEIARAAEADAHLWLRRQVERLRP